MRQVSTLCIFKPITFSWLYLHKADGIKKIRRKHFKRTCCNSQQGTISSRFQASPITAFPYSLRRKGCYFVSTSKIKPHIQQLKKKKKKKGEKKTCISRSRNIGLILTERHKKGNSKEPKDLRSC